MSVNTTDECISHLISVKQENPDIKPHQMYDELKQWLKENSTYTFDYTMSIVQDLDMILFNVSGSFRTTAYNFPKEGDEIIINDQIYHAVNVGMLTFDIE